MHYDKLFGKSMIIYPDA